MNDQGSRNQDTVRVTVKEVGSYEVPAGLNLRETLRREGVYIDGTCSDSGICGRCAVKIIEGDTGFPSDRERGLLGENSVQEGYRLACGIVVRGDLAIDVELDRILEIDRAGRWKEVWENSLWDPGLADSKPGGFGVAVDLGTTAIISCLYDLSRGKLLDMKSSANPQIPWGDDILSRLSAAAEDPEIAVKLSESAWHTIREQVGSLCRRTGVSGGRIDRLVAVGNSAMHHLSLGLQVKELLTPPFSPVDYSARVLGPGDLPVELPVNSHAQIYFPPLVGGYAGSDALVSILAARGSGVLTGAVLDVGTNTEIAVWKGEASIAGTAPSGPAFEGGRISRGMTATEGAVWKVSAVDGRVALEVIGGGQPAGICGTGMVDAMAVMLQLGLIDHTGLIASDPHPMIRNGAFVLDEASGVSLSGEDIAELQKAKSAVAATFEVILKAMDLTAGDLDAVFLAGSFGSRLNIDSAMATGLLPAIPPDRYKLAGNTALTGASMLLFSDEERANLETLRGGMKHHDVAQDEDFEDMFVKNLFFP